MGCVTCFLGEYWHTLTKNSSTVLATIYIYIHWRVSICDVIIWIQSNSPGAAPAIQPAVARFRQERLWLRGVGRHNDCARHAGPADVHVQRLQLQHGVWSVGVQHVVCCVLDGCGGRLLLWSRRPLPREPNMDVCMAGSEPADRATVGACSVPSYRSNRVCSAL